MQKYTEEIESLMYTYYFSLSEKDKRHYVAVEVAKLEQGGINYITELFDCHRETIATECVRNNFGISKRAQREELVLERLQKNRIWQDLNQLEIEASKEYVETLKSGGLNVQHPVPK
jgi:hypothetical protein